MGSWYRYYYRYRDPLYNSLNVQILSVQYRDHLFVRISSPRPSNTDVDIRSKNGVLDIHIIDIVTPIPCTDAETPVYFVNAIEQEDDRF